MNFMISPFSESTSPTGVPEASSGSGSGRKVSFSSQDHFDDLSLPSLLYPYCSTPSPPPPPASFLSMASSNGPSASQAVTISVPVFNVEQVLQKMDRLYDATFSSWIKSEENVAISTIHLKRISIEYSLGRILHGLVWLIQSWKLESIKMLIQGLWMDDFWTENTSTLSHMSQTRVNKIVMVRELLSSIRRRQSRPSSKKSTLRLDEENDKEKPILLKEHAKCVEDLMLKWAPDQKFQFLFHYCTLQSLSYREGENQYSISKWSLPEIFEFVHHLTLLQAEFKNHLCYSIQLTFFMASGSLASLQTLAPMPTTRSMQRQCPNKTGSFAKSRRLCSARRSGEPKYTARSLPCEENAPASEEPYSHRHFSPQSIDIFSNSQALLPSSQPHESPQQSSPQSPLTTPRHSFLFSRPYLLPRIVLSGSSNGGSGSTPTTPYSPIQPMRPIGPTRLPLNNPMPSRHPMSHPWFRAT